MAKKVKKAAKKPARKRSTEHKRLSVSEKITVRMSPQLLEALDSEVVRIGELRPDLRPTRVSVIRSCLRKTILEPSEVWWNHPEVQMSLRQEGDLMEAEGDMLLESGEGPAGRSLYLLAAAKELEMLAVFENSDENIILSSIFRILFLLREGTEYKCLPTIPSGKVVQ